ncbi:MAG: gamma subclass chorismate mutase AroQ [Gammaproteobacteria bacterium]|nr:gamma subclass chorismate mutase AroQ [Gammaproteobacteria bacterium]MBQ0838358.1 gamma subclass chorismate mutase AroQ [Gammaproteobacteria bacterium]
MSPRAANVLAGVPDLKAFFSPQFYLLLCWLLFGSLLTLPLQASEPVKPVVATQQLFQLIVVRLGLMKDVAAYKFTHNIALENKPREQVVLASAMASVGEQQLQPESVEAFFRLQIEMAKAIQRGWIKRWTAEGLDSAALAQRMAIADLNSDLRPQLIQLGEQLVAVLPRALAQLHNSEQFVSHLQQLEKTIDQDFVNAAMKRDLFEALLKIRSTNPQEKNKLAAILNKGVLRVGTTGDYKPFSFYDKNTAQYSGVDIDLAHHLASSLGVTLQLVPSSWPTLMTDLAADKFDVGMSGISRTLLRQRSAFFSTAYYSGGKTPIGRCDNIARLNSLGDIDQQNIRVIVNPGGTNEKFVRANIQRAQIIIYPDNTTIFDQLIDGQAEVMITDAIEVKLQQSLHPELCATMPGELLSHSEKAFLMPQDSALKAYVDAWLGELVRSAQLQARFKRYLD